MERPLLWHQGLFLQPQHFQLLDLHTSSLLEPLHRYLIPSFWGVVRMEIRQASLNTGRFHLDAGEFIFPDTTHVTIPGNAVVQARSFEGAWTDGAKPFTVYLGLRRLNRMGPNVTAGRDQSDQPATTRFVADPTEEEINDLHEGGPSARVTRLSYALRILWETERDTFGDYETIPVARLERRGDEVVLSDDFIPPVISVLSSDALARLVSDVRDQISSRGFQLEGYKRDRGIHTADFGSRDMVYLLALRTLNRYIPALVHMTETATHPWTVYGILRMLVGELSTFSERCTVTGEMEGSQALPRYDHLNLAHCFGRVRSLVTALLDEITAGPDYVFAMTYDGTYFSADLPPAVFEGGNRYYLMVQTEADPQQVLKVLASGAKLGSRENLPLLIVRALPGATLRYLERPPQELPRRPGALYFQIDHHHDQWSFVSAGRNVALYWDSAPEDLKVELMVVGRS